MNLVVVSHKPCWSCTASPSGYATHGGFPFQMRAISELFDATTLVLPYKNPSSRVGEIPLTGRNLTVLPLKFLSGQDMGRKIRFPFWLARNGLTILDQCLKADAVHTPIPGDIGTVGMLAAFILNKPLFVRHCGNWLRPVTLAERFWKWFMIHNGGGKNVMLATGGANQPPSSRNPHIKWIFSTSLTDAELKVCAIPRHLAAEGQKRLIIVCRQEKEKGTDVVIQGLPSIVDTFPDVLLDVVGDGSALRAFQELAISLGLEGRVHFHGKVDHNGVINLLKQADLFCYPTSASEGFPKVVLEALACGLPVVTTRVSVLPQLIDNQSGLLLSEATPSNVSWAVKKIFSDPDLYHTMSKKALETARMYSLERWRDVIGASLSEQWGKAFAQ